MEQSDLYFLFGIRTRILVKGMWLKYMVVVVAGFGCGVGLTSMIAMAVNVIKRMLEPTMW